MIGRAQVHWKHMGSTATLLLPAQHLSTAKAQLQITQVLLTWHGIKNFSVSLHEVHMHTHMYPLTPHTKTGES